MPTVETIIKDIRDLRYTQIALIKAIKRIDKTILKIKKTLKEICKATENSLVSIADQTDRNTKEILRLRSNIRKNNTDLQILEDQIKALVKRFDQFKGGNNE